MAGADCCLLKGASFKTAAFLAQTVPSAWNVVCLGWNIWVNLSKMTDLCQNALRYGLDISPDIWLRINALCPWLLKVPLWCWLTNERETKSDHQVWRCTATTPPLDRLRWEGSKAKVSPGYTSRLFQDKTQKETYKDRLLGKLPLFWLIKNSIFRKRKLASSSYTLFLLRGIHTNTRMWTSTLEWQ